MTPHAESRSRNPVTAESPVAGQSSFEADSDRSADRYGLSSYERGQIIEIAGWKAEPPGLVVEAMEAVTHPIVKLAERFISEESVRDAIKIAYKDADLLSHPAEVAKYGDVASVHQLRHGDLARCDRLAEHFARVSARKSAVRGTAMTAGPILSMEISIMYALKAVHTIGCCYGFMPNDRHEKRYVLQTLLIASAGSMSEKQHAIVDLHALEDVLLEELVEDIIEEESDVLLQKALEELAGSSMPLVGLAVGAVTNGAITYHTAKVAQRVFQERWLRANGKVGVIHPDPRFAHSRLQRAESAVSACFYWTSFLVSFAATFPPVLVASLLPKDSSAVRGLDDGAAAAASDARELPGRLRKVFSFTGRSEARPAAIPAPA